MSRRVSAARASVGFNWGHLDTIVFLSLDFIDSSYLQGYGRAMRGVRKSPLLVYVMEYEKSMDQRVMQIVEIKSAMAVEIDPTQVAGKISANKLRSGQSLLRLDFSLAADTWRTQQKTAYGGLPVSR